MSTRKLLVTLISGLLIGLNLLTFMSAYPEMFGHDTSGKARDFSAYYIAAWRFLNDPSTIYRGAAIAGQYVISPHPATFKYPPFFMLLIIPFLLGSYQSGIVVFNIVQFAMLPGIAFLIFKTMSWRGRSVIAMVPVLVLTLLAPFSAPQFLLLQYRVKFVEAFFASGSLSQLQDGFSNAYYWQWVEGNARVLEMLLFFLSIFLATKKSPLSGVAFGLSTFDPRMALLALPVTLAFNRTARNISRFFDGLALTLSINIPLMLYSNIGGQFITEALQSSPFLFYAYEWIPIYSILAFTVLNLDLLIPRLGQIFAKSIFRLSRPPNVNIPPSPTHEFSEESRPHDPSEPNSMPDTPQESNNFSQERARVASDQS